MADVGSFFRPILRLYAPAVAAIATLIVAATALSVVPAFIGGRIVDSLVGGRVNETASLAVALVCLTAAAAVCGALEGYLVAFVAEHVGAEIKRRLHDRTLRLSLAFFRRHPVGEMINRIDDDVNLLSATLVNAVEPAVAAMIGLGVTLTIMLWYDRRLTAIAVATIPLWLAAFKPASQSLATLRPAIMRARDVLASVCAETLSYDSVATIKGASAYAGEQSRFTAATVELMNLRLRAAAIARTLQVVLLTLTSLGPAAVIVAGAFLVIRHETTIGTLVAFFSLQGRLYGPVGQLCALKLQMVTVRAVLARTAEILAAPLEQSGTNRPVAKVLQACELVIRPGATPLSFVIATGERALVIGPSGSGKTTLAGLLVRQSEPLAGALYFGECALSDIALDDLRRRVVLVPQRAAFFARSIRENITLARPGAGDDEVWQALMLCSAASFVRALPRGLDTVLEREHLFSGGELQRLAIARAIVAAPELLILDEATSALDVETENAVLSALDRALDGVTLIVISHRHDVHPSSRIVIDLALTAQAATTA